MKKPEFNYFAVQLILDAWRATAGDSETYANALANAAESLDAETIVQTMQRMTTDIATFGWAEPDQTLERVHKTGAIMMDAWLVEDPAWTDDGFPPQVNAVLDFADSLCGSRIVGKMLGFPTVNTEGTSELVAATVMTCDVASLVAEIGASADERINLVDKFYLLQQTDPST